MKNIKNIVIALLAVLVVVLGILLFVTQSDKGKLADTNAGLTVQVENLSGEKDRLEKQVADLEQEAAQAAEAAKSEMDSALRDAAAAAQEQIDETVKAKEEAEAALTAVRNEAAAAQKQIDEAVKAKEEAEAALIAARNEAAEAATAEPPYGPDMDVAAVFPSWNPDSEALKELVSFVLASLDESGIGYIPREDRIAVFDMDGTIICEKAPIYLDSCLTMYRVLDDPTYSASEEERTAMQEMRSHAYATGENYKPETFTKDDLIASAFEGMTPAEFRDYVVHFADSTEAVGFSGMTYSQSFYKPMMEVIGFLRTCGYDVWMVSACEREIVRAITERLGFPYDHVVATDVVYRASGSGDKPADEYNMQKEEKIVLGSPLNEIEVGKSGKPAAIAREIGKRPVLAFGNSSGDYSMLNYAEGNPDHAGMGVLIVCDDTVREYGSEEKAADFYAETEKQGWTAFSMANDWLTIYGEGVEKTGLPGAEEPSGTQEDGILQPAA